jgi:hypothetical protein
VPIVIVIISGFAGGINSYLEKSASYAHLEIPPMEIALFSDFLKKYYFTKPILVDEVLRNIVLSLILWFLMVSLYYIAARMLRGGPTYKSILQLVGYAYLPLIVGNMFGSLTSLVNSFLTAFITLGFGIWSLILKIYAVSTASGFSFGRGAVSVLIPTALISILTFGVIMFILLSSMGV